MSTGEPAAPHWLRQLLRATPVPIPWKRAARAAGAIGGAITIGMLVGRLDLGVLASTGALCATLADTDGPYRYRASRLGWVVAAGAVGFFLGTVTAGHAVLSAVLLILTAGVSAVISAGGSTASTAGLQLLVFAVVGSAQAASPVTATACFLAGAGLAVLLAVGPWPVRATAPERAAVADVYDELAAMLAGTGTGHGRQARQRLTAALNLAYDRLLGARSRLSGRDLAYRRLLTLLSTTTPVVEASVAVLHSRTPPPGEVVLHLVRLADAIRVDDPLPPAPRHEGGPRAVTALYQGLHGLDERAKPIDTERTSARERLRGWLDSVVAGPVTWRFTLRLMTCVALATLVGAVLPLQHANWVALTVAIVLKPDFGSVFGRAVLRAGGTTIGVLLGAGVLAVDPHGWALVVLVVVIAFVLPIGKARNYGMFSVFVTPLVIVQLDLARAGDHGLVLARFADTAIGCAIVLIAGYLLWPGSRRADVGDKLADSVDTIGDYLERSLSGSPQGRSTLRRAAYRQLSDLRTVFQQAIVEPSSSGRQAAAWWPLIVGLERLADAVTGVAVAIERGADPVPPADVAAAHQAVREIAAAVRNQRAPRHVSLPESERLGGLVAELASLTRTLRGPRLDRRSTRPPVRRRVRRFLARGRRRTWVR